MRSQQAPDIDDNPDPDDLFKTLVSACEANPQSLGELRRKHEIQPQEIARIMKAYPGIFSIVDNSGRPHVKLLVSPMEALVTKPTPLFAQFELKILRVLNDAKKTGVTQNRLHSHHRISTATSTRFVADHPGLVELVTRKDQQGRLRTFVRLIQKPEAIEAPVPVATSETVASEAPQSVETADEQSNAKAIDPSDETLLRDRNVLAEFLSVPRGSSWLCEVSHLSLERIRLIAQTFPESRIGIEQRYPSVHSDFIISMRHAPVPEVRVETPPPKPPAIEGPKLSAEDMKKMRWKPGGRDRSLNEHRSRYRERHPLIQLPE
jgi:hypothetical protein